MAGNAFDPHDVPDIPDVDIYEEPDDDLVPIIAYSIPIPEDIPLPPPPPEPEDARPDKQQVDYLNLPGLRTLSEPLKGKTRLLVRVEQLLPRPAPICAG